MLDFDSLPILRRRRYNAIDVKIPKQIDEQIEELMAQKSVVLPNLKVVEGVETRLWSDDDYERRQTYRAYPILRRPRIARWEYTMKTHDSVKEVHPEWDAKRIFTEAEKMWGQLPTEEKVDLEHKERVDWARYFKQREEVDAGRDISEISPEEAERLYEEHLKFGKLIKGKRGVDYIEKEIAEGREGVMDQSSLNEMRRLAEETNVWAQKEREAEQVKLRGPKYKWIEVGTAAGVEAETEAEIENGDEAETEVEIENGDGEWVKVQHDEL